MRFEKTFCSQCGGEFGPGDSGYSHCQDHRAEKIVTSHWSKPIPDRRFDWEATFDNYDLGSPIGYGPTEQDAIADLLEQVEE